jgi:hypothetical protein
MQVNINILLPRNHASCSTSAAIDVADALSGL